MRHARNRGRKVFLYSSIVWHLSMLEQYQFSFSKNDDAMFSGIFY
ncbi:hypothetical protein PT7_1637 [Pusillimonas sp. T7-7]|nr:hypothetical protein PT7_1637 [Pusillimonas sp. T7-7]